MPSVDERLAAKEVAGTWGFRVAIGRDLLTGSYGTVGRTIQGGKRKAQQKTIRIVRSAAIGNLLGRAVNVRRLTRQCGRSTSDVWAAPTPRGLPEPRRPCSGPRIASQNVKRHENHSGPQPRSAGMPPGR
jgi:hypothetical protein